MLTNAVHNVADPKGQAKTFHLEGKIAETAFEGFLSEKLLQQVQEYTPTVMREVPKLCWLVDLMKVTDWDLGTRNPGKKLSKYFHENGGQHMAFAVPSPRLRMIIGAVAFAVGMRATFHPTREEALAKLRSMPS
jgi:hypothetical protein